MNQSLYKRPKDGNISMAKKNNKLSVVSVDFFSYDFFNDETNSSYY
jgi:hypothetical protein